jgi:hypothetical protein
MYWSFFWRQPPFSAASRPEQAIRPRRRPLRPGLAQGYDDSAWELLSEDNGTFAYRIPAEKMPDVTIGDQVVHAGNDLREVVAIVEKTEELLVIHTTTGNMAKLFPSDVILFIDTYMMTATVEYPAANRSVIVLYTLFVVFK